MMLTRLHIQNIVLIREANLLFNAGLTVLTGETGAGKSILLDALGLVLGKRAETKLVRAGESFAQVCAEFDVGHANHIKHFLEESDLEVEDALIIRRKIKADGSSKAYINDQPVTLRLLKNLGDMLIEIHGQHGQKGLLDAVNHQKILDSYAKNQELLQQVQTHYRRWKKASDAIITLHDSLEQAERERDYLMHIIKELASLAPEVGEEERLVEQRAAFMQAEKTGAVLKETSAFLNGAQPVAELVRRAQSALMRSPIASEPQAQQVIEGLERCMGELADAEITLEELIRADGYDERALEQAEERLFALRGAARKHRVSTDELAEILCNAQEKIDTLDHSNERLSVLEKERSAAAVLFQKASEVLRVARKKAIITLESAMHTELKPLKMESTRFRILCEAKEEAEWSATGADMIAFEVSTNQGSPFAPLGAIASGGELSRFMLALAVVLGGSQHAPMMIFDEIDTGTGGAVADAIGARLAHLAKEAQVCVVTHLPQVAARGHSHYFIEKHVVDEATQTDVVMLDGAARHEELARMLSGAQVTQEARDAASKLLEASAA